MRCGTAIADIHCWLAKNVRKIATFSTGSVFFYIPAKNISSFSSNFLLYFFFFATFLILLQTLFVQRTLLNTVVMLAQKEIKSTPPSTRLLSLNQAAIKARFVLTAERNYAFFTLLHDNIYNLKFYHAIVQNF